MISRSTSAQCRGLLRGRRGWRWRLQSVRWQGRAVPISWGLTAASRGTGRGKILRHILNSAVEEQARYYAKGDEHKYKELLAACKRSQQGP